MRVLLSRWRLITVSWIMKDLFWPLCLRHLTRLYVFAPRENSFGWLSLRRSCRKALKKVSRWRLLCPYRRNLKSCDGKCNFECAYQAACFQWSEGEVFDFSAKKCKIISDCTSPKHLLSSLQFFLNTICRTLDYYVDPFSSKDIKLVTEEFPYRSFTTLSSELVNLYSNSDYNISIYTNDAYLTDGEFMVINTTSVILRPIPSYQSMNQKGLYKKIDDRPLLIPTHFNSMGLQKKYFFMLSSTLMLTPTRQ
ncbi:unnamed protein product [Moneuplotes crassus]|uniref:Uncharacterized protein n=1 Tax=Euplotes crassus TaxID=5936 RepID=A0AAD1XLS9_EUPCR|nr:unnamed protein product [Moneuplotes crassus]